MEELTPIERVLAGSAQGCSPGACLEANELLEMAERGKRARNYSERIAHVALCPACRSTLKMLTAAEQARPQRSFALAWPRFGYWAVAGLATACLAAWLFMPRGGVPGALAPVAVRQASPSPPVLLPRPDEPVVAAKTHDRPRPEAPRIAHRVGHRRRVGRHGAPPILRDVDLGGGTLEGTVGEAQIVEGEVGTGGGVVEGEVRPTKPPPSA